MHGDKPAGSLELPAAPVFPEPEHVTEHRRFAVPLGTLQDLHGPDPNTRAESEC